MAFFGDIVHEKLFSVLSSRNKEIYIEALFLVMEQLQEDRTTIERKKLVELINFDLHNELLSMSCDDEDSSEEYIPTSDKASRIVNELVNKGWFESDASSQNDFKDTLTVDPAAFDILKTLYNLAHEQKAEYKGYVLSTYKLLLGADKTPDDLYILLKKAADNTSDYIHALQKLESKIRKYFKKLAALDIKDILATHFNKYLIDAGKMLEPIRANDSIYKFKAEILLVLNEWQDNDEIFNRIAAQGMKDGKFETELESRVEVGRMLSFVISAYTTRLEELIDSIEETHRRYLTTATDRIKMYTNRTANLKGTLLTILKHCSEIPEEELTMFIKLTRVQSIDNDSLYKERKPRAEVVTDTMEIDEEEDATGTAEELRELLENRVTSAQVERYVGESCRKGRCTTAEIKMDSDQDYLMFLCALAQCDENDSSDYIYTCTGDGEVRRGRYILPEIEFKRKNNNV